VGQSLLLKRIPLEIGATRRKDGAPKHRGWSTQLCREDAEFLLLFITESIWIVVESELKARIQLIVETRRPDFRGSAVNVP
jgi:hypothetical protein